MKRYLLFGFDRYYPGGGLSDVIVSFDNMSEINWDDIEYQLEYQFYQVLDMDKRHKTGINVEYEIERYEDEYGDIEYGSKRDEIRREIIKEFIKNSL